MFHSNAFPGGIYPPYFKELSRNNPIKRLEPPPEVIIPLVQNIGAHARAVVKAGDEVKIGTLIGNSEKFISACIHASVSGRVKAIRRMAHPVLGRCEAILIDSDGKDEKAYGQDSTENIASQSPDDIVDVVRNAGIVGLGGAAFPSHVKLTPPKEKRIDTFILNGAECEPYLTCDDRVMQERPKEVTEGALLIMKSLGADKGFVVIEDNKPEAIEAMRSSLKSLGQPADKLQLVVLPAKYPQGGEKQLIKAVMRKEVPPECLPFDVGCIVDNIQTALAVYEAVDTGKPLYERVITVTGDGIKEPSNLLVRIGTPVSYIVEKCGGFKETPGKIIIGGPMMGIAQYTDEISVIKGTSGILVLSKKFLKKKDPDYCIRCGKCVEVCPMNLIPTDIAKAAEYKHFSIASSLHVQDCMECGCCAYSCPSAIPLIQLIKHAKRSLLCQI